jgi:hypothetical protein
MREQIPAELRSLPQWVVSGADKVPLQPRTGLKASVTRPSTWGTFEEANRAGYPNVGFVLTAEDPFTIIDLDNKPEDPATDEEKEYYGKLVASFQSYTEISISGLGCHIIVIGKIPQGVKKNHIEIYSSARYMICTGNVYRHWPIRDGQEGLDKMLKDLKHAPTLTLVENEAIDPQLVKTDEELIAQASRAKDGEKFDYLYYGNWMPSDLYPSQSEADHGLVAIITFYSKDNEQVRRVFRNSALGKRDKATKNDAYLNYSIRKARTVQAGPLIEYQAIVAQSAAVMGNAAIKPMILPPTAVPLTENQFLGDEDSPPEMLYPPPGLMGDLAQYFYQSSFLGIREFAIAGAIGAMAGVCGRSYNISSIGLNHYILVIARSGGGKAGPKSSIERLFKAVKTAAPLMVSQSTQTHMMDSFAGPSKFASGPALIRTLDDKSCFISLVGEFGGPLILMQDPRNSNMNTLEQVLLELWMESGASGIIRESAYSDKEKNTKIVNSPNLSFIGETTPGDFYGNLDVSQIHRGLIPRITIVEYKGKSPPDNERSGGPPPEELLNRFIEIVQIAVKNADERLPPISVQYGVGAEEVLRVFRKEGKENSDNLDLTEAERDVWTRSGLKAQKLAALIAVGCYPHSPVIDIVMAKWAIDFTRRDIGSILLHCRSGDLGEGDTKKLFELKKAVDTYLNPKSGITLKSDAYKEMNKAQVIPRSWLLTRIGEKPCFKRDRRNVSGSLTAMIDELVKSGCLVEVPKKLLIENFKFSGQAYKFIRTWEKE